MMPGKFRRICTEVDTFVENHGVDSYKKTYRIDTSTDELLLDPVIYRSNESYEKTFGAGVTEDHVAAFIEYWGVDQYKEWCARDTTYDSIISNGLYAAAQQKFLEKKMSMYDEVDPGIRGYRMNPFRQELRDHKGVAVPEPDSPKLEDFDDPSYDLYIQNNGIINYMLKVNSKKPLEHLLNYVEVAIWQWAYIRNLEYDEKIVFI
jgi:hypothetical protein